MVQRGPVVGRATIAGVIAGALGVLTTFLMYWLVVPGVVLGLFAIALGLRGRRQVHSEAAAVAITLGVVGLLAVPAFLLAADGAEEWGRDCALDPSHDPNC